MTSQAPTLLIQQVPIIHFQITCWTGSWTLQAGFLMAITLELDIWIAWNWWSWKIMQFYDINDIIFNFYRVEFWIFSSIQMYNLSEVVFVALERRNCIWWRMNWQYGRADGADRWVKWKKMWAPTHTFSLWGNISQRRKQKIDRLPKNKNWQIAKK